MLYNYNKKFANYDLQSNFCQFLPCGTSNLSKFNLSKILSYSWWSRLIFHVLMRNGEWSFTWDPLLDNPFFSRLSRWKLLKYMGLWFTLRNIDSVSHTYNCLTDNKTLKFRLPHCFLLLPQYLHTPNCFYQWQIFIS